MQTKLDALKLIHLYGTEVRYALLKVAVASQISQGATPPQANNTQLYSCLYLNIVW